MEQWADLGAGERVRIEVRRRSNARRLSLRVSQTDGRVSLSAPKWVSAREITQFLDQHRDWLGTALTGVADREALLMEKLVAFKRAGCSGILTYHALRAAEAMQKG